MFNNLKITTRLVVSYLLFSILVVLVCVFSLYQMNKLSVLLARDLPESIAQIDKASHLDALAQFIRYYDEVLTQSARNYAFAKDEKWEKRYQDVVPQLDMIIKEAIDKGDEKDKNFFESVDSANLALVDMELKSFELVKGGKEKEAVIILESDKYWQQKHIYEQGLRDYVARRGKNYNETVVASTDTINKITNKTSSVVGNSSKLIIVISILDLILVILFGFLTSRSISRPIKYLTKIMNTFREGDHSQRANINSTDEIGFLANSFNVMADELSSLNDDLKNKIEQKTKDLSGKVEELEKTNKLMIGRELKMIEMKEKIANLEKGKK